MKREKLIEFRGSRSQSEVASHYGISQQMWSQLENGVARPNVLIMKRLEDDIGIPMEAIFPDVFTTDGC